MTRCAACVWMLTHPNISFGYHYFKEVLALWHL